MPNSQQSRPLTTEEQFRMLFDRTAKLNDKVSALLAPAWGSEMGIIPTDHPLYQGEKPPAAQEEQGAPVDWQAIAHQRERELRTEGERKRAEQLEELLSVAHETSNRSEAERARAVLRAEAAYRTLDTRTTEWNQAQAAIERVRVVRDRWLNTTLEPGQVRRLLDDVTRALDGTEQTAKPEASEKPKRPTPFECAPGNRCNACAVCWS